MLKYTRIIIISFLFTLCFLSPVEAATTTKSIKLNKGAAVRLAKTPNKIKWKSANKKIATVNSKGLAKGKAIGKTTITSTLGTKTYKYYITIKKRPASLPKYWSGISYTNAGKVIRSSKIDFSKESQYFKSYSISTKVYDRIKGKSFPLNGKIAISDLRYIKVLHYNWKHEIQVGELIVNKNIASQTCSIFRQLFDQEYPIYSMYLIDDFWKGSGSKSDDYSCKMNNTSAFCYRTISGTKTLSNHAYGYAIDINPKQNPCVRKKDGIWVTSQSNATAYIDRSIKRKGMITHSDRAYLYFCKAGFLWGGDWNSVKDYQHFEFPKP